MKKLTVILLLITISISAQNKVNCDTFLKILNENRILAQKNNAVGIVDLDGTIIVPFKYEKLFDIRKYQISATLFATVDLKTRKKVLIDIENGENIVKNVENLLEIFVIENYAVIETGVSLSLGGQKRFYINSKGTVLFEIPQNEYKLPFITGAPHDGIIRLARYNQSNSYNSKTQEFTYFDLSGKPLNNQTFKYYSGNYENGLALNSLEKEGIYYYGFMDKNGSQKIDFKFSKPPTDFSDEMSRVKSVDDKFGYINLSGEVVIAPKYKEASGFYKGYALVQKENKKWALIDKEDNIIEEYENIGAIDYLPKNSQRTQHISTLIDEELLVIRSKFKSKIMNLKGEILFDDKTFKGEHLKNGVIIFNHYNSEKRKKESILLNKLGEKILIAEPSMF